MTFFSRYKRPCANTLLLLKNNRLFQTSELIGKRTNPIVCAECIRGKLLPQAIPTFDAWCQRQGHTSTKQPADPLLQSSSISAGMICRENEGELVTGDYPKARQPPRGLRCDQRRCFPGKRGSLAYQSPFYWSGGHFFPAPSPGLAFCKKKKKNTRKKCAWAPLEWWPSAKKKPVAFKSDTKNRQHHKFVYRRP